LALDWDHLFTLLPGGYDVKGTAADGEYFDEEAAERGVKFFELFLTHVKGELAGQPFMLEDWQKAINGCIYGWKRADGTRRFREAYVLVPRKNGKSTYAAGFALSGLTIDHEQGAEVYSIAADRMQAALVFDQAKVMALKDEELQKHLIAHKYCIANPTTNSIYKPLSAEASTKHGLNTSLAIIDELHAQPNAELVEVIQTSTGARKQPLIIYITTADYCRESIANDIYEYAKKVRDGLLQDSSFLPVIYEATLQDDWTDREVWAKANPNMGSPLPRTT
jgi:phage terminase large subunit-like protein